MSGREQTATQQSSVSSKNTNGATAANEGWSLRGLTLLRFVFLSFLSIAMVGLMIIPMEISFANFSDEVEAALRKQATINLRKGTVASANFFSRFFKTKDVMGPSLISKALRDTGRADGYSIAPLSHDGLPNSTTGKSNLPPSTVRWSEKLNRTVSHNFSSYAIPGTSNASGAAARILEDSGLAASVNRSEHLDMFFPSPFWFFEDFFASFIGVDGNHSQIRFFPGPIDLTGLDSSFLPGRPWFQAALSNKSKSHISTPYRDSVTEQWVVTFSKFIADSQIEGDVVAGVDVTISALRLAVQQFESGEDSSRITLLQKSDGVVVSDRQFDSDTLELLHYYNLTQPSIPSEVWSKVVSTTSSSSSSSGVSEQFTDTDGSSWLYFATTVPGHEDQYIFMAFVPFAVVREPVETILNDIDQVERTSLLIVIIVLCVTLLFAVVFAVCFSGRISKPLEQMTNNLHLMEKTLMRPHFKYDDNLVSSEISSGLGAEVEQLRSAYLEKVASLYPDPKGETYQRHSLVKKRDLYAHQSMKTSSSLLLKAKGDESATEPLSPRSVLEPLQVGPPRKRFAVLELWQQSGDHQQMVEEGGGGVAHGAERKRENQSQEERVEATKIEEQTLKTEFKSPPEEAKPNEPIFSQEQQGPPPVQQSTGERTRKDVQKNSIDEGSSPKLATLRRRKAATSPTSDSPKGNEEETTTTTAAATADNSLLPQQKEQTTEKVVNLPPHREEERISENSTTAGSSGAAAVDPVLGEEVTSSPASPTSSLLKASASGYGGDASSKPKYSSLAELRRATLRRNAEE